MQEAPQSAEHDGTPTYVMYSYLRRKIQNLKELSIRRQIMLAPLKTDTDTDTDKDTLHLYQQAINFNKE